MALRKPPCPPNCAERRPACQGNCEKYKEYRAALDEDNRIIREGKEKRRRWTESRNKAFNAREKFKQKLSRGVVHK